MLKKLMLAAVLMFTAVSLFAAPKVQVRQYTKEAACETLLRSLAFGDADAFFALLTREGQQKLLQKAGSRENGLRKFTEVAGFNAEVRSQLQKILQDKTQCAAFVKEMANKLPLKKVGYKWYLDTGDQEQEASCHNSKEELIEALMKSVCEDDADILWETFSPDFQKKLLAESNDEVKTKVQALREFTKSIGGDAVQKIKELMGNDAMRKVLIQKEIEVLGKAFVQIDGKWYLDFSRLQL